MRNSLILAAMALAVPPSAARAQSAGAATPAAAPAAPNGAPSTAATSEPALKKYYSKTVNDYVKAQAKKVGAFVVHDDVLGKDWRLKMLKVHTERIWDRGDGRFFACADLREVGGRKTKLDLDFYVHRAGDQWMMDKVVVHKVAGKARYTYVQDGGKWYTENSETKQRTPVE